MSSRKTEKYLHYEMTRKFYLNKYFCIELNQRLPVVQNEGNWTIKNCKKTEKLAVIDFKDNKKIKGDCKIIRQM